MRALFDGGNSVELDWPEVMPGEEKPGLYVAVGAAGKARPIRVPGAKRAEGEALYVPHELSCPAAPEPEHRESGDGPSIDALDRRAALGDDDARPDPEAARERR